MAHLDRFGIFDIAASGVRLQPVRGGDVDEVELVLGLRERGRLFLKAGTEVGGGEGGGVSAAATLTSLHSSYHLQLERRLREPVALSR